MIIGVPNNSGFLGGIKTLDRECLNLPPHHLTRWNKETFHFIEKKFNVKLVDLIEEPLNKNNVTSIVIDRLYRIIKVKPLLTLMLKLNVQYVLSLIFKNYYYNKYKGHTILAIYKKN